MTDFLSHFLGGLTMGWYLAAMIWALLGALTSLYIHAEKTRDVMSENTPKKFSWSFLIWDNIQRFIIAGFLTFTVLRFSADLLGIEPSIYIGFLLGFFSDRVAGVFANLEWKARK